MSLQFVRNFCIIAHIDHGKSTLADRLLEETGTISEREMKSQVLDSMDLERERGITIKATAVRLDYVAKDGNKYVLNLIDTPGHVDFSYEVSRSLSACEGVLLVVDAAQGIQAQTIANAYLAIEHDLEIIPVINKIDLPAARPEEVEHQLEQVFGFNKDEIIHASAKEGKGTEEILETVVSRIPPPKGEYDAPTRALIFDSAYNSYRGVIVYVRVVDGRITRRSKIRLMSSGATYEVAETGSFRPNMTPTDSLETGEVGYLIAGIKSLHDVRVGDTVTEDRRAAKEPLPGYEDVHPVVYCGLFPVDGNRYEDLSAALDRLSLNDSSFEYVPENSHALGFGFRCGFLGRLHMEIIQERLEREFDLELVASAPSVVYSVIKKGGETVHVDNPAAFPSPGEIEQIMEPYIEMDILVPTEYMGAVYDLCEKRRGIHKKAEYLEGNRLLIFFELPLSESITDFNDRLKSTTRGYGSYDYRHIGYRPAEVVKLDMLLNSDVVDALSTIVPRDRAYEVGRALGQKLKEIIPRQLFEVVIQAAIGSKVVARETVRPLRKNVTAKCYGGDVTRKRKLLEKQKEGKRRMKRVGQVDVPQEAFMAVLKME